MKVRRVSGSQGLTGAADATLLMTQSVKGYATVRGVGRDFEEFDLRMKFNGRIWEPAEAPVAELHIDTAGKIMMLFSEKPSWTIDEIKTALDDVKPDTVHAALSRKCDSGKLVRTGRGEYTIPQLVKTGTELTAPLIGHEEEYFPDSASRN